MRHAKAIRKTYGIYSKGVTNVSTKLIPFQNAGTTQDDALQNQFTAYVKRAIY